MTDTPDFETLFRLTRQMPPEALILAGTCVLILYLGIWAVICFYLWRNAARVPAEHRRLAPGLVWLQLIPLFNIWWLFVLTRRLSTGWKTHFEARNDFSQGGCGARIGFVLATTHAVSNAAQFVPNTLVQILNVLISLAFFVLLIAYLIVINDLAKRSEAGQQG